MPLRQGHKLAGFVLLTLLLVQSGQAQHSHGILTPGVTFPKDDSVCFSIEFV